MINFRYIGSFYKFDVMVDDTNNIVNFFEYDKKENVTYCLQWNKGIITSEEITLNRCKAFWFKLMNTNLNLKKNKHLVPFEQVFEKGFYKDFIIPIKEGKEHNFKVGAIKVD